MKKVIILIISFVLIPFITGSASSEKAEIEENNGILHFFEGEKNDEYIIELQSSSEEIDIWILSQTEYKKYFSDDDFNIEWKVENVTDGEWAWKLKSNEQWILLFNNPNNVSCQIDYDVYKIGNFDPIFTYYNCNVCIYYGAFLCIIVIIIILILRYIIKENQKERNDKDLFSTQNNFDEINDLYGNYHLKHCSSCGAKLEFIKLPKKCPFCDHNIPQ